MQSRSRKVLRRQSDCDAIIKQLQNDFQVFEYLKENHLEETNIEEYAKLLNSLTVTHLDKKQTFTRIDCEYQHLIDKKTDEDEQLAGERTHILEGIHQSTSKEMEVKSELEKEIVETKKSLNLLKGDIGHLVGRNESAKLLSSKISKVKIVAEDQLKRVTLAHIKDKEEIKLRNEMQKKFSKKLRNVSNYETNSLARLKKSYADIILKKQDIFDKLVASQKISQNVEEAQMLKQLKAQKDEENKLALEDLFNLASVTQEFAISNLGQRIDPNELEARVREYYSSLPSLELNSYEGMTQKISQAISQVLAQHERIEESIKNLSHFYREMLAIRKENQQKLGYYEVEERELLRKYSVQLQEKFKISHQEEEDYQLKLKQFGKILNTLFVILSYLEKDLSFQNTYPFHYKLFSFESDTQGDKRPLRYNFINCLSRAHRLLWSQLRNDEINFCPVRHERQMNEFYDVLIKNVRNWLMRMKKRMCEDYEQAVESGMLSHRESVRSGRQQTTHFKKESVSVEHEEDDMYQIEEEEQHLNQPGSSKCWKSAGLSVGARKESMKAKRIRLLEGIDTDYYKMIKSTIKMEKENTRKNYQFLRTFKRAKYSSRDKILQEKRFESSFSFLFTKQSVPNQSQTRHNISSKNLSSSFNPANTSNFPASFTLSRQFNKPWLKNSSIKKVGYSGKCSPRLDLSLSRSNGDCLNKSRMTEKLKFAMQFI